ncbi:MAG: hypothetical protein HUK09_02710 [Bacteroidaceae bacterium]|nr:hypothetical protein [Bacteroidaceae bacterium]
MQDNQPRTYHLRDGGRITAATAAEFVKELHAGSFFDNEGTDEAYMVRFAARHQVSTGRLVRTDTPEHFVEDLKGTGYILPD